ncbi:helix-turn-helix transcriptional regulator [Archangium sp.]|uniref:helix-turn-helix domain-containing protein n=1 Tax=Archangium sp. TaxID=1872627 RepID=UPI00286ADCD8|nr:helix-turn-helix transcriptional regulator [Archangium sp.]
MNAPRDWPLLTNPTTEAPHPTPAPALRWSPTLPPLGPFLETVTGTGSTLALALLLFSPGRITDSHTLLRTQAFPHVALSPLADDASETGRLPRPVPPLMRLRELTGLTVKQLAEVFGVTRAAAHEWLNGTQPRGERQAHLLEALQFIETAAEQLQGQQELSQWLQTPVAAGAQTPLQLMGERRWRALRGLLVSARTSASFARVPEPLPMPVSSLSPEALREARERLSPSPALEDSED